MSAEEIARGGYNLDARNPRGVKTEILLNPKELVAKLLMVETEIGKHLKGIEQILERGL